MLMRASLCMHPTHMSLGIGISDDGSMSGSGGSGSDMAICDSSGLKRFFVTYREPVTIRRDGDQDACCLQTQARLYSADLPRWNNQLANDGQEYLIWAHEARARMVQRIIMAGEEYTLNITVAVPNFAIETRIGPEGLAERSEAFEVQASSIAVGNRCNIIFISSFCALN